MDYKKGLFYVRMVNGEVRELFCTLQDEPEGVTRFRVQNLALLSFGTSGQPNFGTETESFGQGAEVGEVVVGSILLRAATDDDLNKFASQWDHRHHDIRDWLRRVEYLNLVSPEEMARLVEIVRATVPDLSTM